MKYCLAVDSGGTKVLAILYDQDFRPIRVCRVGSTRGNTTSAELVERNIRQLIDSLQLEGLHLDCLHGIMDECLSARIRQVCHVETFIRRSELEMGLGAAGIFGDGYMALSGTGTGLVARYQGKILGLGGYGAAVSDEGSGYWLAREAFNAAIWDDEQRGARTVLTDLIAGHFGYTRESLRPAIFSIYAQNAVSPVACVASCAPLVTKAACEGDAVALDILSRTGRSLGQQLTALVRKYDLPKALPITISGSVWRGHPVIFKTFCQVIQDFGMGESIVIPDFEPIVGAILCHHHQLQQKYTAGDLARFRQLYPQYLYTIETSSNRRK